MSSEKQMIVLKCTENFLPSEKLRYAVEVGPDDEAIAWVLDLPGCHILTHLSRCEENAKKAAEGYLSWLRWHGERVKESTYRLERLEVIRSRENKRKGRTSVFFQADAEPVSLPYLQWCLQLMAFTRSDLLALVDGVSAETMNRRKFGEIGWTPKLYLQHIANAERWYLTKLWPKLPYLGRARTPFERLERVRRLVREKLEGATDEERTRVIRVPDGEKWSLRKVLRRILYHELYHIRTIKALLCSQT